jgi:hypothetical protein
MEQFISHWTDFHEIWYFSIFQNSVEKIEISLKSDKNQGYFTWRSILIFDLSYQFFLEWETFQVNVCRKNQNTHFVFSIFLSFFFENPAVYELMWKNIVRRSRPQMAIWRIRVACWIPKGTNTQSEYVIITPFPLQHWLHELTSMLRYTHIAVIVVWCSDTLESFFSPSPGQVCRKFWWEYSGFK